MKGRVESGRRGVEPAERHRAVQLRRCEEESGDYDSDREGGEGFGGTGETGGEG